MSTIRNPVGPQPKKVYWRRRLVFALVIVAVIVAIILIIVRPGSGGTPAANPPVSPAATTPASSAAATDALPAAPPTTPSAIDSGSTTAPGEVAACAGSDIAIEPITDASSYAAGVLPQLSFSITNKGSAPCKINAGTSQQIYTITSGDETYWVSTDCQTGASDTDAVLEPGVVVTSTPFTWNRTRSSADTCTQTDLPQVPAGGASYHLDVQVAGIQDAGSTQFILN
jgi:hypothetical protein